MKIAVFILLFSSLVFATDEAVDWGTCGTELTGICAEKNSDKEKHDCIGKMDRAKVSKDCFLKFKSLCKRFEKRCSHYHVNKKIKK